MTLEANKSTVRHYLNAWQKGDLDTLKQMLAPDAITHVSAVKDESSAEFEPFACDAWVKGFPHTTLHIDNLVAEGEFVAVYWVIEAMHTGEFMDMPPTQKTVRFGGLEINRVVNGKIAEIWRLSDTTTLMSQLNAD